VISRLGGTGYVRQYRHRSLAYFTACLTANQLATCLALGNSLSRFLSGTPALKGLSPVGTTIFLVYIHHSRHTQRIKIIGQLSLNPMAKVLLRGRQIFKFGLLSKKDNKKNLKIRLVFNRMVVAFFRPTILIQNRCASFKKNCEI
jgi:hypothetical protein